MANYIYGAIALNGGVTGSLDTIDGTDLATGDAAIVFTSSATYIYTLDESSGGVENSPNLIAPDANAGNKRWILVSSRAAESALDVSAFDGVLDANDDDVQNALNTIDDMFAAGDFTVGAGSVALNDDVGKAVLTDSGTATPASHQLKILGSGKVNTTGADDTVTISVDDLNIVTKTSAYTITVDDDIVIGNCAGGNITLTLPQASTKSKITIFKKSSDNILTVDCYGTETIEALSSLEITDEYGSLSLVSDGVNTWARSSAAVASSGATSETIAKTSSTTLTAADLSGFNTIHNDGASGEVILTWFTFAIGQGAMFYVNDAQYLQIKAPTGVTIRIGAVQTAAGGYIRSNVVGNWVKVVAMPDELVVVGYGGTWNYDE